MSETSVQTLAYNTIEKGSQSFHWAGLLLPQKVRDGTFMLYSWCRLVDDITDDSELGRYSDGVVTGAHKKALSEQLQQFEKVFSDFQIPTYYAKEMHAGMDMDKNAMVYRTEEDLILYCYRVAGVVGLMMSHVIGVSDAKALRHACDLGIAMQLTNIARDIAEDKKRSRSYLPEIWFQEAGLKTDAPLTAHNYAAYFNMTTRLLNKAEYYYQSGMQGLPYLSFRTAVAIAVAAHIYRDIGRRIIKIGPNYFANRVSTSAFRKAILTARALWQVSVSRLLRGPYFWQPTTLTTIWRAP